jgi:hypothetical protein
MLLNDLFPTPSRAGDLNGYVSDARVDEVIDRLCQSLDDLTANLTSAAACCRRFK